MEPHIFGLIVAFYLMFMLYKHKPWRKKKKNDGDMYV